MTADREIPSVVGRVAAILQAFSEGYSVLSLKQVADRCDLAPSTAHRLLEQMVKEGLIDRAPQRRYCVGAELIRIATVIKTKVKLVEVARPIMQDIVRKIEMTCFLSLYVPSRVRRIPLARMDPDKPLGYRLRPPEHQSLVWGAAGRSILAYLTREEVDAALAEAPPSPTTGKPPPTRAVLARTLARVRARGYEIARGELLSRETVAIAAPVFAAEQKIAGNLTVAAHSSAWTPALEQRAAKILVTEASRLSALLGWPPPVAGRRLAG